MTEFLRNMRSSLYEIRNIRALITSAMLVALSVALGMLTWQIMPTVKITFGYLAIGAVGLLFGPALACLCGVLSDLLNFMLFPTGPYFPGFTLSAALGGLVYGMFLYKNKAGIVRIILARACVIVFINLLLNTVWLVIMQGNAFWAILPPRILKNILQLPFDVCFMYFLYKVMVRSTVMVERRLKKE